MVKTPIQKNAPTTVKNKIKPKQQTQELIGEKKDFFSCQLGPQSTRGMATCLLTGERREDLRRGLSQFFPE